jgi:MFS family permease
LRSAFGDDAVVLHETNFRLLLLATMFPILGTALVSPILDSVIGPFGTTEANIGLMISVFTAPSILIIPVSGVLADRYGRKPVLVVALLLFGVGGAGIALTTDFRVVLALRAVQGVGLGGIVPTITTSIGDMYTGEREVTGQGLRMMSNGVSSAVFPLVSGAAVVVAWRYPFLLYAAAIPIAVAVYLWFTDPSAEDNVSADSDRPDSGTYYRALSTFVRHPRTVSLLVARALPVVVWVGFLTYNSIIVSRVMGGTPFQAGVLVAMSSLVFASLASQVGRILALFDGKFYSSIAANLLMAIGFMGFLFAPRASLAAPWIIVGGAGFGLSISLYRSYVTELPPETLRGGVVSLSAAGDRLAATLTPVLMGAAIQTMTPMLGRTLAVQAASVGAAAVGGGGAVLCLLVASASRPIPGDVADLVCQ